MTITCNSKIGYEDFNGEAECLWSPHIPSEAIRGGTSMQTLYTVWLRLEKSISTLENNVSLGFILKNYQVFLQNDGGRIKKKLKDFEIAR